MLMKKNMREKIPMNKESHTLIKGIAKGLTIPSRVGELKFKSREDYEAFSVRIHHAFGYDPYWKFRSPNEVVDIEDFIEYTLGHIRADGFKDVPKETKIIDGLLKASDRSEIGEYPLHKTTHKALGDTVDD